MKPTLKPQLLATGLGLAFVGVATAAAQAATPATPPSITVFDQKVQANTLSVDYAYLPADGYIVIYGADKDGNPIKEPLGHAELKAGDHRGVKIEFKSAPKTGTTLWASLYSDKDGKPGFDRSGDAPFWNDALPMQNRFVIR